MPRLVFVLQRRIHGLSLGLSEQPNIDLYSSQCFQVWSWLEITGTVANCIFFKYFRRIDDNNLSA